MDISRLNDDVDQFSVFVLSDFRKYDYLSSGSSLDSILLL